MSKKIENAVAVVATSNSVAVVKPVIIENAASSFVAVALHSVAPNMLNLEKRALLGDKPAAFMLNSEAKAVAVDSDGRKNDYVRRHQVEPNRVSSMSAEMPSIKNAREHGNAYAHMLASDYKADTTPKYQAYQALPAMIYAAFAKAGKPVTANELLDMLPKKARDTFKSDTLFLTTVRDVLADLSLYGLAARDSVKVNVKSTRFLSVPPADVKLLGEQ